MRIVWNHHQADAARKLVTVTAAPGVHDLVFSIITTVNINRCVPYVAEGDLLLCSQEYVNTYISGLIRLYLSGMYDVYCLFCLPTTSCCR